MRIIFDKKHLALEQTNYAAEIVNTYIICDLDSWPRILLNNFKLKNCYISKTSDKEKWGIVAMK